MYIIQHTWFTPNLQVLTKTHSMLLVFTLYYVNAWLIMRNILRWSLDLIYN